MHLNTLDACLIYFSNSTSEEGFTQDKHNFELNALPQLSPSLSFQTTVWPCHQPVEPRIYPCTLNRCQVLLSDSWDLHYQTPPPPDLYSLISCYYDFLPWSKFQSFNQGPVQTPLTLWSHPWFPVKGQGPSCFWISRIFCFYILH